MYRMNKKDNKIPPPAALEITILSYRDVGSFEDAISEERLKSRQLRCSNGGGKCMEEALILHNLGDLYFMMGKLNLAITSYEKSCEIQISLLGEKNVDLALTHNNIGVVLLKQGQYDRAMEYFESVLSIRQQKLGHNHEKCSDALHNMGLAQRYLKNYKKAIDFYEQSLKVRKIQLGKKRVMELKIADTLYNLAIAYAFNSQYTNAFKSHKKALTAYRKTAITSSRFPVTNTLQWIKWFQKSSKVVTN
mmetsp:Transcript_18195/g.21014  ORF Transcript_18195/g.21014 Transcript_18195/m.21014 type:complete len:248 (+) Transcript_18195:126-869(+)